ncbi:MAG TPA: cytochrome c [Anaerolineae bacterium]|jgi:cytochrome c2|nr:cytochrome c [Anaerolineae bacterium]
MRRFTLFFILVLALALVACGGDDGGASEPAGEASASRGEELYKQTAIGAASAPGCITCHSLDADVVLVGPPHAGVATRAETAVAGMSSAEFLEQSIVEPDEVITEGFSPGVMYQNYGSDLTDQEVADLVAFLETLK